MSRLQILVTTMHATDFAKYDEMNLQTDAVIANQANDDYEQMQIINGNVVKLVTTSTRGVSKNRNLAIANIGVDTEYVMFSDDDLRFHDNYENIVLKAFKEHPEADAIKFNLNSISERKICMKSIEKYHKTTRREVASWGVCGLAIKATIIKDKKLYFNERFGPGVENYCGEDTIFLQELFKNRVKTYASPECIADIDQSNSSWFEGYTEKYYTNAGMLISEVYPGLCYPLIVRSAYRFSKREQNTFGFWKILKCYYRGTQLNKRYHQMNKS